MDSTKSKSRKLNVRLLRKIQKHILAEPRRLEMIALARFGKPGSPVFPLSPEKQTFPACGTTHCIAGWALQLSGKRCVGTPKEIWEASLILGLNGYYGGLFFVDDWPTKFRVAYGRAKRPATRARITSRRLDHLITTGK